MQEETDKFQLAVIFLITAVLLGQAHAATSCMTQSMSVGACVPILRCEAITTLLITSPKPLPNSIVQFVRRSHCGTFNDVHHVCCDRNRVTPESSTPSISLLTTPTPFNTTETRLDIGPRILQAATRSNEHIQAGMNILEASECGERKYYQVAPGEQADLSEYPWMALLVYYNGSHRTLDCSGSLITERYVLTAAHCIRMRVRTKRLVSVRLGEHDTKEASDCSGSGELKLCAPPIQEIDIEEAVYHESHHPTQFSDDIGLLRLISKAIFRSNVQPICLPVTSRLQRHTSGQMSIAGWNLIENGTCKGDSGGPIFFSAYYRRRFRYIQYGVITAGSFWCGSRFPGLYSRITSYLPWIAGNLSP